MRLNVDNIDKYKNAFKEAMEAEAKDLEKMTRNTFQKWDSIGHMNLISIIEDDFGIELKPEDILNFSSYFAGIKIMKKYGIEL